MYIERASILAIVATLSLVAAASEANAQSAVTYTGMRIHGTRQGDIKGGMTQKGREGQIRVYRITHVITSPRDRVSGLPTGRRQHAPLILAIDLDKSLPLLHAAMSNNESLDRVEIDVWQPNYQAGMGAEVKRYTIKLTNASISRISERQEPDATGAQTRFSVDLELTYQKIEWIWVDGGVTADDDWEMPVSGLTGDPGPDRVAAIPRPSASPCTPSPGGAIRAWDRRRGPASPRTWRA